MSDSEVGKGAVDAEEAMVVDLGETGESPAQPEADGEEADQAEVSDADPEATSVEAERDQYLDSLRRLQADFENYRKRVARQQADIYERANEALVVKLLPVLDTADLAVAHASGDEVVQLRGSLLDVLGKAGLERIDPEGGPFDPNLHDAVAHEPGEGGEQEVAEVLRAGYRWNGRVLRPAMVKVRG
ncbi:MAG: nucleotide exchange factor GrpE [Acidimicrobiaceae bacterium]|nr:nucleotide exchange factor GrpE [Acidimicrobiaceae bacterium]